LKLRLPEGFDLYELRVRQVCASGSSRHVDVHVGVEQARDADSRERELVQAYFEAATNAAADGCDRGTRRCGAAAVARE